MIKARVKANYRWAIVQAFCGREYVKGEWREVPGNVDPVHPDLDFVFPEETAVVAEDEPKAGRPKK